MHIFLYPINRILHYHDYLKFYLLKFFWLHLIVCGILVPQAGIKPAHPGMEAWILNHWTAREILSLLFLMQQEPETAW